MKLPISTFFTLLVIAFAGSSRAQGEEDRNSGLSKRPPGQALARAQNFSIMELSNDSVLISGMWEVVPQGQNTGTPLHSTPLHSASAWHFLYKMVFGRLYSSIIRQCPDRKLANFREVDLLIVQ
jgi:hypothetical protein